MKKALNPLVAVVMFATVAFAANVENPLYAPAPLGFYSKTGFGWMYKKGDDNLAMTAKGWDHQVETKIFRIYEDFGFGLTNRFAIRGAFGYTHDSDIDRSGPHNARLGLNYRGVDAPVEAVVWDVYMDAWLGGISKMKASLIAAKVPQMQENPPYLLTFNYDNYANGRWGMWFGTQVGKTFDKLTLSAYGEFQKTFGNNNNQIKIDDGAKPIIGLLVKNGVISSTCDDVAAATQGAVSAESCKANPGSIPLATMGGASVDAVATGVADAYVAGLPADFNVDTKSTVDYAAGLKALYEIDKDWSIGGGFAWRHRDANSVEALNITNSSPALSDAQKKGITKGVADNFVGSMEDGTEEFTLTLLGSRQITENLQLTLFGEYTFDTVEEKSQLGTDIKAEIGLRLGWQF
jgi:hypothetical protein